MSEQKGPIDVQALVQKPPPKLGEGYHILRPEVKATIDKVMYELELITKTMCVMETRIASSENKLQNVLRYIREDDLQFRPQLSESVIPYQLYKAADKYILGKAGDNLAESLDQREPVDVVPEEDPAFGSEEEEGADEANVFAQNIAEEEQP